MSKTPEFNNANHTHRIPDTGLYYGAERLLSLPRSVKQIIFISADFAISLLCLFSVVSLKFGHIANHVNPFILGFYAAVPLIGLYFIGFYQGVARIFCDAVMRNVLKLFVGIIIAYELVIYFGWLSVIPSSIPILYSFLFFIWLWSSRLSAREILERLQGNNKIYDKSHVYYNNVIIYGAGSAGKDLYDALKRSHKYNVVAFIDDNSQLSGAHLLGKKIYNADSLISLIDKFNVSQVFLALPSVNRLRKLQIINELSHISVKIKQLPSLHEIADGQVTISHMRPVDILDVLERQAVEPNEDLLQKNITDKNVLVTGAGGSIGSELCRQIINNKPRSLVLYEQSEYALYSINQELINQKSSNADYQDIEIISILGSVGNEKKLSNIFKNNHINTVYHAAAYKHVPIVESNPFEGIINNTKGTYHCARAAIQARVETFVLISTDKAVRPTNIMGASKRLAELVCQGLSQTHSYTCFSMVRFGNVLGSSGSVVPLFTKQIEQGGPITITHPEITRYFMTIPEAACLVIQAGAMALGGEVFVLDMGEPVKIVDLAKRMIRLTGCELKDENNPNGDIEIIFTGLRPGEKLYEELIIGEDNIEVTCHPLIRQAMEHSCPLGYIENTLSQLTYRAQSHDVEWLKKEFMRFVEGYHEGCATPAGIVKLQVLIDKDSGSTAIQDNKELMF